MQEVLKMTYILVETNNASGIFSPLKTTNRIKFLSFAASSSYIIFGATSGGLYVYDRESFTFITLIPNKEGPVSCVRISPDEKWFAFSTARGVSCVLEHNGSSVNRRILSHEHEGLKVTALQWNSSSTQLYVGDNTGRISVIRVASYLTPAVSLMQLDSSIVQLDSCSYMLLASTKTRTYLCDTFREQYRQIGTRLRDGEFGACFYSVHPHESYPNISQDINFDLKDISGHFSSLSEGEWLLADKHLQNIKLYCARPGLRLWEVRVDGAVMSTHQFKQLQDTTPVKVIQPSSMGLLLKSQEQTLQNIALRFSKIYKLSSKYLLTFDSNGFFVLDPMTSEVILWTDQFKNIADVFVVGEIIYLWMGGCRLHALSFSPIDTFLVRLYLQKQYLFCTQLCASYSSTLKKLAHVSSKMHVLVDLLEKLRDNHDCSLDDVILSQASDFLAEVSKNAQNKEHSQMLNSGIFIVGNAHLLSQKEDLRTLKPLNYSSEKLQFNSLKTNLSSNLPTSQDTSHKERDQEDRESGNGLFHNITPALSLPLLPESSQASSDEDYDPFPDLPLSSLTSAEAVMALKNLTTTVSGTISNGTKSLKEKWQSFEEKLRRQEESGLSVEKSVNRCGAKPSYSSQNDGREEDSVPVQLKGKDIKLPIALFVECCHQVSSHNGSNLQELQLEMLNSFSFLYDKFRNLDQPEEPRSGLLEITEVCKHFGNWLNMGDLTPFPFQLNFDAEFVNSLSLLFLDCLKSGTLVRWLSQFSPVIDLDYRLFPSHIGRIHSKELLLLDQSLGRFLQICSTLLDPSSAMQCLDDSNALCHYFTWNVIMDHFHKGPTVGSDEKSSHTWPLPRILNAMLVMLQLGQVESCRNMGENVSVKHVLRTVLKVKDDSRQIFNLFLLYLDKLPESTFKSEVEDPEVYYFTRLAYETLHETELDSQCACGYPINEVKNQRPHDIVGKTLLSHIYHTEGQNEATSFCQKTGVLWHHLLVLRRDESLDEVLPLILQVNCEEELKNRCSEFSPSTWVLLFDLKVKLEEGFCLHCSTKHTSSNDSGNKKTSWAMLASLLVQETNIEYAVDLLSKYSHSIPAGCLSLNFYQSCLLATITETQSCGLKRNLLQALTDYKAMPAISSKLSDMLGHHNGQSRHHWGLKLQLAESNCLCCMLPLASSSGGSVVGFYCSHSFHSVCLQQRFIKKCPICTE